MRKRTRPHCVGCNCGKMPKQKPGKSIQTYETPSDLLDAIKTRWDIEAFDLDLAAKDVAASKGLAFISPEQDSLAETTLWPPDVDLWLNPPFGKITPWVAKAAHWVENGHGGGVLWMLLPAAVGTEWYRQHVEPHAQVYALNPRVTFVGQEDPFIKDLMLVVYGTGEKGFETWRWK